MIKKHYRSKLNFTYDSLNAIRQDIKKIIRFLLVLDSVIKNEPMGGVDDAIRSCEKEILKDLCEDMNVSNAITALFEFINKMNALMMNISMSEAKAIKEFMFKIDGIFGFIESAYKRHNDGFKTIMKEAGLDGEEEIRLALRDAGELEKADAIRDNFKKHGIDMEIRR